MIDKIELFENTKISKAVWNLALPTILSMVVIIIYNIADTYFIGQTNNTSMVAAISLSMPLFLLFNAIGNLFGTGGSTTISRNLGEKREARAKKVSSFSYWCSLLSGIIFGAAILLLRNNIVSLLGANGDTKEFVFQYISILALGAPLIILSFASGIILRSEGASKQSMIGSIIGTITNIILDPILILHFNLGVEGAAIATVVGNAFSTIYYTQYIIRKSSYLSIKFSDFSGKDKILINVVSIGLAGSIADAMMSFVNILYNNFLSSYGTAAIAAAGISLKGSFILAMIIIGLATGAQPLIGYNFGSKNTKRLKDSINYTLKMGIIIGTLISIILIIFARPFVSSFIDDSEVIRIGTSMLRILNSSGCILIFNFIPMIALQAFGKVKASLFLSIARQGIIFVPTAIIANNLFKLNGLMWSQPIADFATFIIGSILLYSELNKIIKEEKDREIIA